MKKHITKRPKGFALALGAPGLLFVIIPVIIAIFVPSALGYVRKAKTVSATNTANTVYRAANSALEDLDEMDVNTLGDYIIASDASKNVNVPFDAEKFYNAGYYYDDFSDKDYFVIVENGYCTGCAVIDDSGYVCTFGSYFENNPNQNFNELYEYAVDYITELECD